MKLFIFIYICGFVCTYLVTKLIRNSSKNNTWSDVGLSIVFSIFSWISFIVLVTIELFRTFKSNAIKNNWFRKNPPKWL